jgi:hypothetical protein
VSAACGASSARGLAADPVSLAEFLMHGFLLDFPTDLIQAARIDGAPDAGDCRAVFPRAPSRHRSDAGYRLS